MLPSDARHQTNRAKAPRRIPKTAESSHPTPFVGHRHAWHVESESYVVTPKNLPALDARKRGLHIIPLVTLPILPTLLHRHANTTRHFWQSFFEGVFQLTRPVAAPHGHRVPTFANQHTKETSSSNC